MFQIQVSCPQTISFLLIKATQQATGSCLNWNLIGVTQQKQMTIYFLRSSEIFCLYQKSASPFASENMLHLISNFLLVVFFFSAFLFYQMNCPPQSNTKNLNIVPKQVFLIRQKKNTASSMRDIYIYNQDKTDACFSGLRYQLLDVCRKSSEKLSLVRSRE